MIRGKYENMADKKKWRVWGCVIMKINPMRPISMLQVPCVLLHGSRSQIYWCLYLQINDCNRFYMEVWKYNKVYQNCFFVHYLNTLRPTQNCRHITDDILKCMFLNENAWFLIMTSLMYALGGLIHNVAPLVQVMAWRQTCNKPLSEPVMPQWVTIDVLAHGMPQGWF